MTTLKPPNPPNDLKVRGRGIWNSILSTYILDIGEQTLLHELGRCVDRIDELDRQLADQLLVTGNRGQIPKASPLIHEIREEQKTVSRLINELALPQGNETVGRKRNPQQRQAAKRRWADRV